jgi:hypothetical protein
MSPRTLGIAACAAVLLVAVYLSLSSPHEVADMIAQPAAEAVGKPATSAASAASAKLNPSSPQHVQSPPCAVAPQHPLIKWLTRVGGYSHGLDVVSTAAATAASTPSSSSSVVATAEGRGVVARCGARQYDILLAVPRRVTIGSCAGTQVLLRSPFAAFVDLAERDLVQPSSLYALFVNWALFDPTARDSKLRRALGPALDAMRTEHRYPAAWTVQERVRANVLLPKMDAGELDANIERVISVTPGIDKSAYTKESFARSLGIVFARAFEFPRGSRARPAPQTVDARLGIMIPVISMLNHENPHNGSHVILGNDTHILFVAGRDLAPGEEVLNSYAKVGEPLTHFIAKFGFVPPAQPSDWIPVSGWLGDGALLIDKDIMLPWIDPEASHVGLPREGDNLPWVRVFADDPRALLPFARLHVYGTEALRALDQDSRDAVARQCFCGAPMMEESDGGERLCGLEPALEAEATAALRQRLAGLVEFYAAPLRKRPDGVSDAAEAVAVNLRARAVEIFTAAGDWVDRHGPYRGRRLFATDADLVTAKGSETPHGEKFDLLPEPDLFVRDL